MGDDQYELSQGYVVTKCYDDFPQIHFHFGDLWLSMEPKDYVVDISDNQDRSLCVLLLSESTSPFFIMGLPIYMDYYTVHDDANNRMGFAPRAGSTKTALLEGTQPDRVFDSLDPEDPPLSLYSWYISAALVLVFSGFWMYLIASSLAKRPGQVHLGTMACVALSFIFIFGIIVYVYLQPLIN